MYLQIKDNGMDGRVQQVFAVMTQLATIQIMAFRMGDPEAVQAFNDTIVKEDTRIKSLQHERDMLEATGRMKEAAKVDVPLPGHMHEIQRMLRGEPVVITLSYDGLFYHCHFDQAKRRLGEKKSTLRGREVIDGPDETKAKHARFIAEVSRLFDAPIEVPDAVVKCT